MTDDPSLVARFRAGTDERAFIDFIEAQRPWLDPVLRSWSGGAEDFYDLRQEVIAALYKSLGAWRGEATPKTFVWRIARNLAISRIRAEARRRKREQRDAERRVAEDNSRAAGENPAARYEEAQEAARVRLALSRLNGDDRSLLTLREIEGLSFAQIAAIHGGTEEALRVRAFRARKKFERAYKEAEHERY